MMSDQLKRGDIIQGKQRGAKDKAYHPIIYFEEFDAHFFVGGMITQSEKYGNIRLGDSHFDQKISNKPQFFVKNYLLKRMEWQPFNLLGRLSEEGINFVMSHLEGTEPQLWEDYTS